MQSLPKLYHKGKKDQIFSWKILVEGSTILTEYGTDEGKKQTASKDAKGKNIGKANETTPEVQAQREAQSMWQSKLDRKYRLTIEEANVPLPLPMLAKRFDKEKKKVTYPCDVQPKLDGCVFHTTQLITTEGKKTIKEIVDNKLDIKVLSYNKKSNLTEFCRVTHWWDNGLLRYQGWLEVVPKYGQPIKCTKNHLFLTDNGWKRADKLNPKQDSLLQNQYNAYLKSLLAGTLLGATSCVVEKRGSGQGWRITFTHTNKDLFDFKVMILGLEGRITKVKTGYGSDGWRFVSTALTHTMFPVKKFYHVGNSSRCGKRKIVPCSVLRKLFSKESLSLWIADDGSLSYNNGNFETPRLSLSTHRYPIEQINEFVNYFNKEWECNPSVYTDKRVKTGGGKFLVFSTKDTFYILTQLRSLQCKGVEYKYFYSTKKYIEPALDEIKPVLFHVRGSRKMPSATKYDIEVEDNHNYFANGFIVHNCRCLAQWEGNRVELTSRSGKPYDCPHITEELEGILPNGIILDGELYKHGETFQAVTRLVKKVRKESIGLSLWVYDIVDKYSMDNKWLLRKTLLDLFFRKMLIDTKYLVHVQSKTATNEAEILDLQAEYMQEGYEGAIVRTAAGVYRWGYRSDALLKVKTFQDDEFPLVGFRSGVGKFFGACIWLCETPEGKTFEVVSKGTMKYKRQLLREAKTHMNDFLKVKYFEKTEAGIPRFPVGLGFRLKRDL